MRSELEMVDSPKCKHNADRVLKQNREESDSTGPGPTYPLSYKPFALKEAILVPSGDCNCCHAELSSASKPGAVAHILKYRQRLANRAKRQSASFCDAGATYFDRRSAFCAGRRAHGTSRGGPDALAS